MKTRNQSNVPDLDDAAVRNATGRGWDEWVALINAWPDSGDGHTAVAAYLRDVHNVEGWWAQGITVGWERLTGRRLRYQMADGTFTANRSRTLEIDPETVRAPILDDARRDAFLNLRNTSLASKPGSKSIRVRVDGSVVLFAFAPLAGGTTRLSIEHAKLRSPEEVESWRTFWGNWLERLAAGS